MANQLDEMNPITKPEGKDINVIAKQLPVSAGLSDYLGAYFIPVIAVLLLIGAITYGAYALILVAILIAGIWFYNYKNSDTYLRQLEQKIQQQASQIDNYLENRVVILQNTAALVEKAIKLDQELLTDIAALRSGTKLARNELNANLESANHGLNIVLENYPDIKAHSEIRDALQQNAYLQREITAARDLYNDVIYTWNREIFAWPLKKIIASQRGLTTRIPFIAAQEVKDQARKVFF